MKTFLKFTLASILGIIIGLFLFVFIFLGAISSASKTKVVSVEENSILVEQFKLPVQDRNPESPLQSFSPASFKADGKIGLNAILNNISKASEDENIRGIFINASYIPAGISSIDEIREALLKFKESGKFIIAHADMYTQSAYYLVSVADKIYLTPEGALNWIGMSSQIMFYKKTLEKLGINAQIIKEGEYKGAPEVFMYEKLSDENRAQIKAYAGSIWNHIIKNIASARNLQTDSLNYLADNLIITNGKSALEYGLIDGLKYFDEVLSELKELTDTPENKDLKAVTMKKYINVSPKRKEKGLQKNKIAVVYASGSIVSGDEEMGDIISSDIFARAIRKARRDSTIKAIVLRVNSGGGSALASEVIWREVKLASEVKPVIASMGDVAASGGYYILAAANKVVANPTTITGSIGVFGMLFNGNKFLDEKLGITTDVVKTNKHSDLASFFRPLDPLETKVLQREIGNIYKTFISRVADGRKMSPEEVDKIARGHVYSGEDALKINLIDEFGGLTKAIEIAAGEAGIDQYRIVNLPEVKDPFELIMKQITGDVKAKIIEKELGRDYMYFKQLKELKNMRGIQARIPFEINIE